MQTRLLNGPDSRARRRGKLVVRFTPANKKPEAYTDGPKSWLTASPDTTGLWKGWPTIRTESSVASSTGWAFNGLWEKVSVPSPCREGSPSRRPPSYACTPVCQRMEGDVVAAIGLGSCVTNDKPAHPGSPAT